MSPRTRTSQSPAELRAGLLAAAAQLFSRRTYSEVGVADIAARAGVAAGTFYRYFPSKDDIVTELRREVLGEVLARAAGVLRAAEQRRTGRPLEGRPLGGRPLEGQPLEGRPLEDRPLGAYQPEDWWEAAELMVDTTVRFWFDDPARSLVVLRGDYTDEAANAEAALCAAFAEGLRIGQDVGAVDRGVDADAAASMLVHGALGIVYHALLEGGRHADELVAAVTHIARKALQPNT